MGDWSLAYYAWKIHHLPPSEYSKLSRREKEVLYAFASYEGEQQENQNKELEKLNLMNQAKQDSKKRLKTF